jgi:hypothetical protein
MPGGHHVWLSRNAGLVIEKHIGGEGLRNADFSGRQKQRFVQADIPFAQGADHPLMGRR